MSRSGYVDDWDDQWGLIRYRGAVASAIRGKRGQAFLRELLTALDALPERKLIAEELEMAGAVCALGAIGRARGIDMTGLDPEDPETVAGTFGIAPALAKEVVFENDEAAPYSVETETDEHRFSRMRRWVEAHIAPARSAR